ESTISRLVRWVWPARSHFSRRTTSPCWATAAASRPTIPRLRTICACCATTDVNRNTSTRWWVTIFGSTKSRLRLGRVELHNIDNLNEHRRRVAARYAERLCGIVKTPPEKKWAYAVYHMYVIQTERRDELVRHLQSKGIGTGIHYPVANHQQPDITKIYGDLPR